MYHIRHIRYVYIKELRSLLRDRNIIVYTVALPAFLYPALFLGIFQVLMYVKGVEEQQISSVQVVGQEAGSFCSFLSGTGQVPEDHREHIEISTGSGLVMNEVRAREKLLGSSIPGGVDAVLDLHTGKRIPGLELPLLEVDLYYSSALGSSNQARARVEDLLDGWRQDRLAMVARVLGEKDALAEPVVVEAVSLARPEEVSRHILGLILPLLMTLMIALGAYYPALETTVAEKERGTLETTLLSPVPLSVVVAGKYLAVTTTAFLSFALNFAAMIITLGQLRSALPIEDFSISPAAILSIVAGAILLAAFLAALMMLLAFLARTFKEGQTYVTPVYLLCLFPVVVVLRPDIAMSPVLSVIPMINTSLLFRSALAGDLQMLPAMICVGSSMLYAVIALAMAARILGQESIATGSDVSLKRVFSFLLVAPRAREVGQR